MSQVSQEYRPSKPLDLLGSASRTSSLTNQKTVHATKSINPRAQPLLQHTNKKQKCLCSCRYGSCWCVTPWHKTDAESPVDIFLSTSQKRSKTHVVTKSLYIKTWFVCSNKFECFSPTAECFGVFSHSKGFGADRSSSKTHSPKVPRFQVKVPI